MTSFWWGQSPKIPLFFSLKRHTDTSLKSLHWFWLIFYRCGRGTWMLYVRGADLTGVSGSAWRGGSRSMLIRLGGRHKLCLTAAESIEQEVRGSPGGQRSCLLVWPLTSVSSDGRPHAEGLNKQKWLISTVVVGLRFEDVKNQMITCFVSFSVHFLIFFISVLYF